jgi:hypothetical protein
MIDVNCGWDLTTALAAVKRLPEVNPRWLEEPLHWYDDRRLLKLLAQKTDIPLSAGESELSAQAWGGSWRLWPSSTTSRSRRTTTAFCMRTLSRAAQRD